MGSVQTQTHSTAPMRLQSLQVRCVKVIIQRYPKRSYPCTVKISHYRALSLFAACQHRQPEDWELALGSQSDNVEIRSECDCTTDCGDAPLRVDQHSSRGYDDLRNGTLVSVKTHELSGQFLQEYGLMFEGCASNGKLVISFPIVVS